MAPDFIVPDWPAPPRVKSLSTTRIGGASSGPWRSFNLGDHVGDDTAAVAQNRALLRRALPAEPLWLRQVHGVRCVDAAAAPSGSEADAAVARRAGVVCAVLTADCLPVLLCDEDGTAVGIAHAGWRGLAAGVLEATLAAMEVPGGRMMAWLGPAIGREAFEVGGEVRYAFLAHDPAAAAAFRPGAGDRWWCDIFMLAGQRLAAQGVQRVFGGGSCTVAEAGRFFSYRRDGSTGRMASLIWLE